jgi:hypothetical protein
LLLTYFFRLRGVLVGTSNRLPEDLYATDFKKSEFSSFLSALQSRCYAIDIDWEKDYRHLMSEQNYRSSIIFGESDLCKQAEIDLDDGESSIYVLTSQPSIVVNYKYHGIKMELFISISMTYVQVCTVLEITSHWHPISILSSSIMYAY